MEICVREADRSGEFQEFSHLLQAFLRDQVDAHDHLGSIHSGSLTAITGAFGKLVSPPTEASMNLSEKYAIF